MIERSVTVPNSLGLHARPAAQLVRLASSFQSQIELVKEDMVVNAKSIMGVMMLAAECGSTIVFRATGDDAEAALQALTELVKQGFGES